MNASMNDRKKAVLLAAVLLVIAILCGIGSMRSPTVPPETVRRSMLIFIKAVNYLRPSVWTQ